ncbi:hypothetical protein B7R22_15805 [Subtercola boreus]|uniref:N-acetyltransferase domain-containing protein n=1 Tax=Subtercola boreus TaxID=120213 RepID=A0A3E0VSB7_9MICO|nr:GNAT family N-acetyltransferase [Subtercola boreus]RFA12273.1 hypothetical protein B7R22_15805 [Subtercola boreus]
MTVTVRPLPDSQFDGWLAAESALYEAERRANGDAPDVAARKSVESNETNFPDGRPLPTHRLLEVLAEGVPVGTLWIGPLDESRPAEWWVYSIDIDEVSRGHGYGRAAMSLAEVVARDNGATTIGLNVFGDNARAQNLYRSLEYRVTAIQMSKEL